MDSRKQGLAQRAEKGAQAEQATGVELRVLESRGWAVFHGRRVPGYRADLDHVLVPPIAQPTVVVLDTKRWHAGWETILHGGRVHCGLEDRHDQIEAVARYAARVRTALGGDVEVWPLVVVHGSRIPGGALTAPVSGGVVHVLSVERLVPEMVKAGQGLPLVSQAGFADRVGRVLPPYRG
ncbi:nuclease-related domain-containing protein [Streptomyces sp. NPDC007074]|uniref:nuclease-related domain-containing protein n=1 Tax=Streptomyces sp. NPDC007074 TaxID=3156764 RepID=UPI0033CA7C28